MPLVKVDQALPPIGSRRLSKRWVLATGCAAIFLLAATVWVFGAPGLAVSQAEQQQIRQAIAADIDYRNALMVTPTAGSSQPGTPFPSMVTAAQKAALVSAPSRREFPDTLIGFRTTISLTSLKLKGQVMWAQFSEATWMPRPKPLPEYGYATPQVAELKKVHGVWMVDSIHFAPGSGMDGATCAANRWAGDC